MRVWWAHGLVEADQLHVAEGEEALEVLVTESCKAIAVRDVHSFDLTVRCVQPYYDYKWFDPKGQRLLSRKAAIRFVNGQYRNDDAFGKLMHDFHCTDPDQMYYDELREIVKYLKKDPEGVKIMCDIMNEAERRWKEQARREGLAEGRAEGRAKGRAKGRAEERENMMRKLHAKGMSFEEIASIMELPLSSIKAFFQKRSKTA